MSRIWHNTDYIMNLSICIDTTVRTEIDTEQHHYI